MTTDPNLIERFERENAELAAMLSELRGTPIVYFANPGNAGDSLIASATYQIFGHYGLDYEVLHTPDDASALRGRTVVLAGGGNLVPLYHGMAAIIERLLPGGNTVIVLPHSVRGNEQLLARLPASWTVFCRELASWRHVRTHASACNARLAHDLALYLDVAELDAGVDGDDVRSRFGTMLAAGTNLTLETITKRPLSCMRHGVERTGLPSGPNYDVAIVFATGVTPGLAESGAWMMLEFARRVSRLTTNRLHVGVAGALVGTPTVLLDNSYGKVSGVYLHSMRGRFPNVSFDGEMLTDAVFASR
jgi:exopolysaccharide biosynthesis predicted pyruvyltransferase EpsI